MKNIDKYQKNEIRYNKNENIDNYFKLARATEEKLQQLSDKVEATDKEREKDIKNDMQEMKQPYDTVNNKLWGLETRIDTMSKDQGESSCAIQSKLEALLRSSTAQDKLATDKTARQQSRFCGTTTEQAGVYTVTPGCSEQRTRGAKTIMKSGTSYTTNGPGDSTTSNNVGPDDMTWANTCEMMNRTMEAFATRNTDSSGRGGGKSKKTFKKP